MAPSTQPNLIPDALPLPQPHLMVAATPPSTPFVALPAGHHQPMPPPPEMQSLMDKTANKTVHSQNAFEFEDLIRRKQASNPQFAFLFRGHPWNHYYEWKKVTLQQQLQMQQNKNNNNPKDDKNNESKPNENAKTATSQPTDLPNIKELNVILSELNGSNHSINSACKWIIDHKDCPKQVCDELKSYFLTNLMNHKDPNIFDKKLYILFMINDVLHQALKTRISIDKIDPLSHHLSTILFTVLPNAYQTYSAQQQQKVMSLLNLWSERSIFNIALTQQLKDAMVGVGNVNNQNSSEQSQSQTTYLTRTHIPPPPINPLRPPPPPHPYQWPTHPHPAPIVVPHPSPFIAPHSVQIVKNTLHLSIGKIVKLALDLRRTGGGGTYVPLPMDKVPINNQSQSEGNDESKLKRAYEQYLKELCLIDNTRKMEQKSYKRGKGSRRRRRGYDSRSRSRSMSRSLSRSRSRSRSKSTSSSS